MTGDEIGWNKMKMDEMDEMDESGQNWLKVDKLDHSG